MHGRQRNRARQSVRALALLLCLFAGAESAAQCRYEVTVIEGPQCAYGQASMYAGRLNDQGHIVGFFKCPTGYAEPFLWTPETGLIELPLPPDSYEASAEDINEAGKIVGTATIAGVGSCGFLYDDGEFTMLPPVIPDAGWSTALAINNHSQVVGYRSIGDEVNPWNAYIWSAEEYFLDLGLMDRPFTYATDISDTGIVVGWRGNQVPGEQEGFRWQNGELTFLGPIPGGISSMPHSVNNRGHIVGNSATEVARSGGLRGLGFIWRNGLWTILQPVPGYEESGASGINDLSQVVGSSGPIGPGDNHATLWQNRVPYELDELAELAPGFTIERSKAINNAGQILGDGSDPEWHDVTFLLTPADRPKGDITGDCEVGAADLLFLLGDWGKTDSPADINDDGVVNVADLLILLGDWG